MKQIFKIFMLAALLAGVAANLHALPAGTGTEVGGVISGDVYVGTTLRGDINASPTFDYPQYHQDSNTNVNLILDYYNTAYDPDLDAQIYDWYKNEAIEDLDLKSGSFSFTPGTEYISMKWAADNGGWFLWYVGDLQTTTFTFEGLGFGLSHYTEWRGDRSPVPEPATMALFGIGLLGIAGISRRKKQ